MLFGSPRTLFQRILKCGKWFLLISLENSIVPTDRRTKKNFAKFIKDLVDQEYCDVEILRIVLDNLKTHFEDAFFEACDKKETKRILRKIEFHYTPKYASWLNIAEIEINVLDVECTGRRMGNNVFLTKELDVWEKRRK